MGKSADISPRKTTEIKTLLLNTDHSQRQIATIAGVSKTVVNRLKLKLDQNLPLEANRTGKSGRKRITTLRTDRKIRDICLQNRKTSVARLTTLINNDGIAVSKRTVQRRLAEEKLTGHRPTIKPRLNSSMIKKRLKWARAHQHWTIEDWNKVIKPCYTVKVLKCDNFTIFFNFTGVLLRRIDF